MEAVHDAGGHEFSYEAHRGKNKLLEEASLLDGELRRALELAVLEKRRVSNVTVR